MKTISSKVSEKFLCAFDASFAAATTNVWISFCFLVVGAFRGLESSLLKLSISRFSSFMLFTKPFSFLLETLPTIKSRSILSSFSVNSSFLVLPAFADLAAFSSCVSSFLEFLIFIQLTAFATSEVIVVSISIFSRLRFFNSSMHSCRCFESSANLSLSNISVIIIHPPQLSLGVVLI